jgi:hypothetical protein
MVLELVITVECIRALPVTTKCGTGITLPSLVLCSFMPLKLVPALEC